MAQKMALVNGLPRMKDESSSPVIYNDYFTVVESGASGENEKNFYSV